MFAVALSCTATARQHAPQGADDGRDTTAEPLTVIAIGDAGESGGTLRGNAGYLNAMQSGEHDAGKFAALIFLGDNFYPIGLNLPAGDADGEIKSVLGPFRPALDDLGRANVHAVPGNHDYYLRNAVEQKLLFGLVTVSEQPIGLTDRGNRREEEIGLWSYHRVMPAEAAYPLAPGSPDSAQFLFIDSALPLRTDPRTWSAPLDSLRNLLESTSRRPGLRWHILCSHHPLYSVGEHGGFTEWNEDSSSVDYLTSCDRDSNALGWVKNWLDPEDLCAERYRQFTDSIRSILRTSGVNVQVWLSGHDHSLQLLYYPWKDPGCRECPRVQIVSGAGSKTSMVKIPAPPYEFTSAQLGAGKQAESLPGFVQLRFAGDRLRVVFFNGRNGDRIDMGGGREVFWIDREGRLLE